MGGEGGERRQQEREVMFPVVKESHEETSYAKGYLGRPLLSYHRMGDGIRVKRCRVPLFSKKMLLAKALKCLV